MPVRRINALIHTLQDLQEREHNDLTGRDSSDAHPSSAITGLSGDLADKVDKAGSIIQIQTRNHNDLHNRDAADAHSWFKNNVRVIKNLYYRKKPKMLLRDVAYTWTSRSASEASGWSSVTWSPELGLFVAVAESGTNRVMTSPDGINWTSRSASEASDWDLVTWSPELGLFVAVAYSGTNQVMTSPDGINWTSRSIPETVPLYGIVWASELGLFVICGYSSIVMTSPDGINWTSRSAPENIQWLSVTWSPELGLFVAVAFGGLVTSQGMTSPDGINWTSITIDASDLESVTWSPELGLFVAVGWGDTGNSVATSPDGINWTGRSASEAANWYNVKWSPELGLFVAVAFLGTGNRVMTSPDGINWTSRIAEASEWSSVTWSPELGLFVTVAFAGTNRVITSRSMFQRYTSDATVSRALNTTYTNSDSRTMTVRATVRCAVTVAGGNAYVQGKSDAADPSTTAVSGIVGIEVGLLNEDNSFEIVFDVAPGMKYRIDSSTTNGTVTLGKWFETM